MTRIPGNMWVRSVIEKRSFDQAGSRESDRTMNDRCPIRNTLHRNSENDHPWAHFVRQRRLRFEHLTDDQVESTLSLDIYRHVRRDEYLSKKFTRTLFPQLTSSDVVLEKLPFVELQTLRDAVRFREHSQKVIDDLFEGIYSVREYPLMKTAENSMPSLLAPPTINGRRPVLYQVVYASREEELLILEAKDFFVMLPDRLDLHCIVLNEQSINVQSHKLGFDPRLVSLKDFVWVWTVEPTRAFLEDPRRILRESRWLRQSACDSTSVYCFRASQYAFVSAACENVYGAVIAVEGEWDPVRCVWDPLLCVRAAFEGAPEPVELYQSMCPFPLVEVREGELLQAEARRNVSCAVRFSEPAASPEDERRLCEFIKYFPTLGLSEGIMPSMVRKLSPEEDEWFEDRLGKFNSYKLNPEMARKKMSKVFNMACSAQAACGSLEFDREIHPVTARIPDIFASPLRLEITLPLMSTESGWAPGQPVAILMEGAETISRVVVKKALNDYEAKRLCVTLVAQGGTERHLIRLIKRAGRQRTVNARVQLGKPPATANPLYETVVRMRLFDNIHAGTVGDTIMDLVYGGKSCPHIVRRSHVSEEELRNLVLTIGERQLTLTSQQQKAVSLGCAGYPIMAVDAIFGSGKTLVATVIAALCSKERVILTGEKNEVIAQIAETLCSIREFRDKRVLRYVPIGNFCREQHTTPVDVDDVLKNLGEKFHDEIQSTADRDICLKFRELFSSSMSTGERKKVLERNFSLLKDTIRIMFGVRFPDVLCITTSSLLNVFSSGGIFADYRNSYSLVICDEAAAIPEPMFIAITNQFPRARQVYVGDLNQFWTHRTWGSSLKLQMLAARSALDLLLKVPSMPRCSMFTSFTAHPALNEIVNLVAYDGHVISGVKPEHRRLVLDRVAFPDPGRPFLFVDVAGAASDTLSESNKEAAVCKEIVVGLLAKGLEPTDLTIVNFFKQNPALMRWAEEYGVTNVTVEQFQNRHSEVVVLLTTTALPPAEGANPSILEKKWRLVAALTRARQALIILGNKGFLKCGEDWSKIIAWAEGFGGVVTSSELHRFLGGPDMAQDETSPSASSADGN
ncbi:hypothetical protein Y032_0165g49 [Ancylostoma ceylanicum]|nr:hypothetical protein Y032_0165g49 [Ancylostoma ceylanicum]